MDHFVGRTGELAVLDAEMQAVRGGQPRVVVVEGEAGIGKSSLVSRFVAEHRDVCLLRASGDEAEMLLAWGVIDQLLAGIGSAAREGSPRAAAARRNDADPLAVGTQLVAVLGDLQAGDRVVVVVVDDLHWSDQLSARALLFALRRMQADRVLGLVSARTDELDRLGDAWSRFAGGDHRVTRLRLGGLDAEDLAALARTVGAGLLSAVARGDLACAGESFAAARQLSRGLSMPFQLALLERDDGRRLRRAADRQGAVACLRQARDRLAALGARPHVAVCERELQACGAEVRPEPGPARWNLTASEMAVARLVATGRSNREVAAELYVSVKAVEYHLGHVFDKIGIRSRRALPGRLAASVSEP